MLRECEWLKTRSDLLDVPVKILHFRPFRCRERVQQASPITPVNIQMLSNFLNIDQGYAPGLENGLDHFFFLDHGRTDTKLVHQAWNIIKAPGSWPRMISE